jgi:tRNA-dihydrouridine synthase 3
MVTQAAQKASSIVWSKILPQYVVPRRPALSAEGTTATRPDSEVSKETKAPIHSGHKRNRGQNKGREGQDLGYKSGFVAAGGVKGQYCRMVATGKICKFGDKCRDEHDFNKYLASRPADLPAHLLAPPGGLALCPVYRTRGTCPSGISCRYSGSHTNPDNGAQLWGEPSGEYAKEVNFLPGDAMYDLRKKRYVYLAGAPGDASVQAPASEASKVLDDGASSEARDRWKGWVSMDARIRAGEKRTIDFREKVYVAPLTTVGNLPFRRIAVDLGADITCGEMAVSTQLVAAIPSEWALVRRHPSERTFGVQLAGSNPAIMAEVAELIERHLEVDFVDINMGCPLDDVCNKGMGAGLMGKPGKMRDILTRMNSILSCPITMKLRAGLEDRAEARFAHKTVQKVRLWSLAASAVGANKALVAAVTIHSRTRQQRYSRYADWEYVHTVVEAASSSSVSASYSQLLADGFKPERLAMGAPGILSSKVDDVVTFSGDVLPSLPVIGNGDILHWEDFYSHSASTGTVTNLLGRGVLIKPWLVQEIKERRTIDISSSERLDILRKFVNYGLEHWGSDQNGVNHTRRFLLEWLSFLYRYVPVGCLEVLPQRMNDRVPAFVGRDDLETLFASPYAQDWIKISEMLLGPVPHDYSFIPKHKSSSIPSGTHVPPAKRVRGGEGMSAAEGEGETQHVTASHVPVVSAVEEEEAEQAVDDWEAEG